MSQTITPQALHRAYIESSDNTSLPDDWGALSSEQRRIFISMARHLNYSEHPLPSRRSLINGHKQAMDTIEAEQAMLPFGDATDRLLQRSLNKNMHQYHQIALDHLQGGGAIEGTIDALNSEELQQKMQAEGYFICFNHEEGHEK